MQDTAITMTESNPVPVRTSYRHGRVPEALREAARQILDNGDIEGVGLREITRRIGVSATAAYRHFESKDHLLASVAAGGFQELAVALQAAAKEPDPETAIGLAYVEFALTKRGLFRLMFGPLLAQKAEYPKLHSAAAAAFEIIQGAGLVGKEPEGRDDSERLAAWGLIHGLSSLFIENLIPEANLRPMAAEILRNAKRAADRSRDQLVTAR